MYLPALYRFWPDYRLSRRSLSASRQYYDAIITDGSHTRCADDAPSRQIEMAADARYGLPHATCREVDVMRYAERATPARRTPPEDITTF